MLSFDCTFNFWRLGALKTTLGWSFGIWLMKTHRFCVWTWLRTTYNIICFICSVAWCRFISWTHIFSGLASCFLPFLDDSVLVLSNLFSSKCLFCSSTSFWLSHILSYTLYFGCCCCNHHFMSPFSTALESFLLPYFIIFFVL